MLGPADLRNRQNLPSLSHRQKRRIKKHLRDPRGKRRAVFAPRRPRMRARGTGKAPEETTAEIPELGKRRKPGASRSQANAVQSRPRESHGLTGSGAAAPACPCRGEASGGRRQWG